MFGLHIPRGLQLNCEDFSQGFIMFTVPNSPLMYLMNRTGAIVHQWKSNYPMMSAYLLDDGSTDGKRSRSGFSRFRIWRTLWKNSAD